MTKIFDRMKSRLSAVGIYSKDAPNLSMELTVYAEELEQLYEKLDLVLRECFISTAENEGLTVYEKLFGPDRDDEPLEKRREMLRLRTNLGEGDFTVEGFEKALDSLGFEYVISEFPSLQRLNITAAAEYSEAWQSFITKEVSKIMPAHLEFQLTFNTRIWQDHDDLDKSFSQLDEENLTWHEIDRLQ